MYEMSPVTEHLFSLLPNNAPELEDKHELGIGS